MLFTVEDMKIIRKVGTWLCLKVKEQGQAISLSMTREGKTYTADIQEQHEKRSLDANAYYWKLCRRLAKALNLPPEEIYHRHIQDIGNYETLCIQEKAVRGFEKRWKSKHLGRFIETRESKLPGCVTVLAYYGSSDFDKREMSMLIDNCIQDCHAVGVETLPPDKIDLIKREWPGG